MVAFGLRQANLLLAGRRGQALPAVLPRSASPMWRRCRPVAPRRRGLGRWPARPGGTCGRPVRVWRPALLSVCPGRYDGEAASRSRYRRALAGDPPTSVCRATSSALILRRREGRSRAAGRSAVPATIGRGEPPVGRSGPRCLASAGRARMQRCARCAARPLLLYRQELGEILQAHFLASPSEVTSSTSGRPDRQQPDGQPGSRPQRGGVPDWQDMANSGLPGRRPTQPETAVASARVGGRGALEARCRMSQTRRFPPMSSHRPPVRGPSTSKAISRSLLALRPELPATPMTNGARRQTQARTSRFTPLCDDSPDFLNGPAGSWVGPQDVPWQPEGAARTTGGGHKRSPLGG